MQRRWLINLLLLLAVAGLALFMWWQPGLTPDPSQRLTTIDLDSILTIRIERPNQKPVVLKKDDRGWRLHAPISARGNPENINRVLQIAAAPARPVANGQGWKASRYGLARPRARLWFNDRELRFGTIHPLNNLLYVGVGNRVALIGLHHFHVIASPLTALASPHLLDRGLRPVAFQFPRQRLILRRGRWRWQPPAKSAGPARAAQLQRGWQTARALSVKPYSGKPAIDRLMVTAVDANGRQTRLKFEVISYQPVFILHRRDEGLEYRFPVTATKRLIP